MLFLIAWRNLWRSRTRSLLIIGSVVLGIWAGAFINAIYFGMGNSRKEIAINHEVSHLQVHHPTFHEDKEPAYAMPAGLLDSVLGVDAAIRSYSLRTVANAMIANASGSRGVQVNGIDPVQENFTRPLASFVVEGAYLDTSMSHRIYVSTRLAERMNLEVGNKVVLTLLDTANAIVAGSFRICGLYASENAPLDEMNTYVLKTELDALLGTAGQVHEAAVLLHREEDMNAVESRLKTGLPFALVENWQVISPETALVLSSLDQFAIVFLIIILIALAFGIVNTMLMAVLERTRELGMLMAVGMSRRRVFGMVLLETILLTLAGVPAGLLLIWGTLDWLGRHGLDLSAVAGEVMRSFGYGSVIYPYLPTYSIGQMIILVCLTAVLSAIFPAVKALRLRPVEAIR